MTTKEKELAKEIQRLRSSLRYWKNKETKLEGYVLELRVDNNRYKIENKILKMEIESLNLEHERI